MRTSCQLYPWRWWQLSLKTCALATLLVGAGGNGLEDPIGVRSISDSDSTKRDIVLVVDVDNTLYNEALLRRLSSSSLGIEEQIVQNIHSYCEKHMGMSKEEADRLHREYGSTIEGLRHLWSNNKGANGSIQEKMKDCYEYIWPPSMDYSALLQLHQPSSRSFSTGYSHNYDSASQLSLLRDLLQAMPCPLYLASNSPRWHVQTVLQALGMLNVPWTGMATPDHPRRGIASSNSKYTIYPTKHSPSIFYRDVLDRNNRAKFPFTHIILVDDSQKNIDILQEQLMTGIHVSPDNPLPTALLQAVGVITVPSSFRNSADSACKYEFSQIQYLQSKNVVDAKSLHRPTWNHLAEKLRSLLRMTPAADDDLQIVDLGAGLLSMFKLITEGDDNNLLPSLIDQLLEGCIRPNALFHGVRYFAYESNKELQSQCIQVLQDLGFKREVAMDDTDHEYIYVGTLKGRPITVHLRTYDYSEDATSAVNPEPHLIVGCCFADLIDPYALVPSLLQKFLSAKGSTKKRPDSCLCYFPITFQGITQFFPPQPFDIRPGKAESLPSDTVAFALYSKALEQIHGHNLDPLRLVRAMKAFGGILLSSGGADWDIDPKQHPYLWETLLYFFERVAGPELIKRGWDAAGWLHRARKPQSKHILKLDSRPSILVSNVDLLFRLPRLGCAKVPFIEDSRDEAIETALDQERIGIEEIVFTEPYKVSTIRKLGADLGPHQVQSTCSLCRVC
jgi:FMN phosphatase YigB (HAD superfamily)